MVRRGALALPRIPAVRPRARFSARALVVVAAAAVAVALAYLAARETSLFALRTVDVAGASPAVETEVRAALDPIVGASLVALDAADVEARLRAVPSVRQARVDRAFPHTLSVAVRPERALAVIRDGRRAWLVAESGRVVGSIEPTGRPRLPRVRAELAAPLRVGTTIGDDGARRALSVLRAVPPRFPARVLYAQVEEETVTLVLRGGLEILLGPADAVEPKLRAAAAVVGALEPDELATLAYVDVSVPEHVVTGGDPQPASEG
jgi:cell division protein FtsQ